jgi:hypothetical protein
LNWLADKVLAPLIAGAVIAGLGSWWLARLNEHYRGQREHLSKSVDSLREQVAGLVTLSSMYWVEAGQSADVATEAEIEFRLAEIGSLMQVCAAELWGDAEGQGPTLLGKLAAAIVTDKYATPRRPADLTRPLEIARAAAEISSAVTKSRSAFFHSKPKFWLFGRASPVILQP